MRDGLRNEDALERFCPSQADGTVLLPVLQRQQRWAQQRRVREIRTVIGKSAELDTGMIVSQGFRSGQTQKAPCFR